MCSNDCMAEFRMGNRTNNSQVKAVQSHAKPISCCAYSPQTHQVMNEKEFPVSRNGTVSQQLKWTTRVQITVLISLYQQGHDNRTISTPH